MIDDFDPSSSTLRMLVSEALKNWKIEGLLKLIEEDDVLVKTAAARELQLRGGKLVFEKIKAYSGSDLAQLREISAFILGQLEIPLLPYKNDSLPILLQLASDINADVRCAAAAAFGHLFYEKMPEEVEKTLMNLCLDEDKDVRACAACSLGNSSGNQGIQNLLREMISQDYVGSYAELGLEIINDKSRKRR